MTIYNFVCLRFVLWLSVVCVVCGCAIVQFVLFACACGVIAVCVLRGVVFCVANAPASNVCFL